MPDSYRRPDDGSRRSGRHGRPTAAPVDTPWWRFVPGLAAGGAVAVVFSGCGWLAQAFGSPGTGGELVEAAGTLSIAAATGILVERGMRAARTAGTDAPMRQATRGKSRAVRQRLLQQSDAISSAHIASAQAYVQELASVIRNGTSSPADLPRLFSRPYFPPHFDAELVQALNTAFATVLSAVHDTIAPAAEESERRTVQLAGTLALRLQALVADLLDQLQAVETTTKDPGLLKVLWTIDNAAALMRRQVENIQVLVGGQTFYVDEGWTGLGEAVRAATAGVRDYPRVDSLCSSTDVVVGHAFPPLVHLLSELIENATRFSPKDTQVTVHGGVTDTGEARIEIIDKGYGIDGEELARLNEMLASPAGGLGARSGRCIGLYVAARLAAMHNVRIQLSSALSRGTAATVLIPADLIKPTAAPESSVPEPPRFLRPAALPPAPPADAQPSADRRAHPASPAPAGHPTARPAPVRPTSPDDGRPSLPRRTRSSPAAAPTGQPEPAVGPAIQADMTALTAAAEGLLAIQSNPESRPYSGE